MAASIPSQERTVDPFASYNSNTVNDHTKMVTYDEEGMANINSLRVTDAMDATSTAVFVSTGFVYKDAVLIQMTGQGTVDFNTADHYYDWDSPGLGFNENGYYYIVMNYVYVKSRPAPQASYQILKPSQRSTFSTGGSWMFLASVLISGVGGSGAQIDSILDYDPEDPDNKRLYVKSYMGTETFLPDHNQTRDQSRVAYDSTADEFYFGYSDRWRSLGKGTGTVIRDTSGLDVGDLVYINASDNVTRAIISAEVSSADGVVIVSDVETGSPPGSIQLIGLVEGVNVESTSPVIAIGDILYLSESEAGTVTTTRTDPLYQVVGRAVSAEAGSKVDILFYNKAVLETTTAAKLEDTLSGGDWISSGGSYYGLVDITDLNIPGENVIVSCCESGSVIIPESIDIPVLNTVRIWMPVNTLTVTVTVVG